jgi:hypothetical protein
LLPERGGRAAGPTTIQPFLKNQQQAWLFLGLWDEEPVLARPIIRERVMPDGPSADDTQTAPGSDWHIRMAL